MTQAQMERCAVALAESRRCVYTTLIGGYERLNEQPVAARSSLPFICLTDDPDLRSNTWQVRPVSPIFAMDPVRSQRELKLRPHLHLPEFDASLYMDNTIVLSDTPERIFDEYFTGAALCVPQHSYRESVFDEFVQVARSGRDDQSRVFEQLNHYTLECPEILEERPYWTAILLRDHRNETVRATMEAWLAHVMRYSRRDQLSANAAFQQAGLRPRTIDVDNFRSWFHTWPHSEGRSQTKEVRYPANAAWPAAAHIRELQLTLEEQARAHETVLLDLSRRHQEDQSQALAEQAQQYEQETICALSAAEQRHEETRLLALARRAQDYEQALSAAEQRHEAMRRAALADQACAHKQALAEQVQRDTAARHQALADQARDYEAALAEAVAQQARQYEAIISAERHQHHTLVASRAWVVASLLQKIAIRFPRLARWGWRGLRLGWWIVTGQLGSRLPEALSRRRAARQPLAPSLALKRSNPHGRTAVAEAD